MAKYRRYLRVGGRSARERERELGEEIEAHLAMREEELMRRGEPRARARALAEARFGDREAVLSSARERDERLRRRDWLVGVRTDVLLAWRQARRSPGTAALTVLIFGLGIGLTTATFTFVDRVLLRPLPYPESERLVALHGADERGAPVEPVSMANWQDWREQNTTLAASALHLPNQVAVTNAGGAYQVQAELVTAGFFDVLRPRMLHGRGLMADDTVPGAGSVVVSEGFWRRELGARRDAGLTAQIGSTRYNVVGVVAAGHAYPAGSELWLAVREGARQTGIFRNYINWRAVARVRAGTSVARAEADLSAIARRIQAAEPESDYSYGVHVVPLRDQVVAGARTYLMLLMGAVGCVLLLVCANLAALNLARGTGRNDEVAVRYALGATRGRVLRQLLTEQLVLALAGGVLGVLLAWWGIRALVRAAAAQLPRVPEIALDLRILAFAIVLSVLAGVLAGLVPAWRTSVVSPRGPVGGRVARGGRGTPGAALVVCEVAAAVLLLTGAGLLVRSFRSVLARDVGFTPAGVATAQVVLTGPRYRAAPDRLSDNWAELLSRVEAHPDIAAAALAEYIPTGIGGVSYLVVDGHGEDPDGAAYRMVSDGYFRTLGVPLLHGRTFDATDRFDTPRVVVINRVLAERYWPNEDPVGKRVKAPGMEGPEANAPWLTIVGVVGHVRHDGYEDDSRRPQLYVLYRQLPPERLRVFHLLARHRSGAAMHAGRILRAEVAAFDNSLPVVPENLDERLGALMTERRLVMSVLSGFGTVSLLLAVIGVYALLSFAVALRAHEMGVRAALGAGRGEIVRLVVGNAARVVLPGAAIGLLLAFWLTRLLEVMLVGVTRTDPVSYVGAALLLTAVALTAALGPARRAARMDPLMTLRAR